LIKNRWILGILLFLTVALNLLFSAYPWHLLSIIAAGMLLMAASQRVVGHLASGKKIRTIFALRSGKALIYLSLSVVISSQYYFYYKNVPAEKIIPEFNFEAIAKLVTPTILSTMIPGASDNPDPAGAMTVDEFIIKNQEEQLAKIREKRSYPLNPTPEQKKMFADQEALENSEILKNQSLILEEGRKQFSEIAGSQVNGSEKVSDIFARAANERLNLYLNPSSSNLSSLPIVPIMTILIFLTLVSIGSVLGALLMPVAAAIVMILIKLGAVGISKKMEEVEELV
jgi:hypothetical protein